MPRASTDTAALRRQVRSLEKKISKALEIYHAAGDEDEMAHALGYSHKCPDCGHEFTEHGFDNEGCYHPDKRTEDGTCPCLRNWES